MKTGKFAVVFTRTSGSNIAIFTRASGSPTLYNAGLGAYYCGYDNNDNLFCPGMNNQAVGFAEFRHGAAPFIDLRIRGSLGAPGQVQWDGKSITYEGHDKNDIRISRLNASGSTATVVGKTQLRGAANAHQTLGCR
jgi:hypothetical protein